ncbi:MAG: MFS transporter [Flavisolibacter sp.]
MRNKNFQLAVLVFAQFAGTSLWFAGNAIIRELEQQAGHTSVAQLTSLVQFGFIAGTLVFALFTIADRYRPSAVFFFSAFAAAVANLLIIFFAKEIFLVSALRFITGFFLAGIYPVGMKIAADRFPQKLGNALGFLVGALVLGTAFPHLLRSQVYALPWKQVLVFTSALAVAGGTLVFLLLPSANNPQPARFQPAAIFHLFRSAKFRAASFGYFGHMWELYTFWAFVPLLLTMHPAAQHLSFWTFIVIAAGAAGCVAGGILSKKTGSKPVAFYSLLFSGACCLFFPLSLQLPIIIFLLFMIAWGITVVSDSPQFSTLVAQSAPADYKGTALTFVTSIGFAITIVSLQVVETLLTSTGKITWVLAAGPLLGLLALSQKRSTAA